MKYINKYINITLLIFFILLCLCLYLYVKAEKFTDTIPIPTIDLISSQLTKEIGRVLHISPRRISNLTFTGDITKRQLTVSFTILERNLIESANDEINANDAITLYTYLFSTGNFIVSINNQNVVLNENTATTPTNKGMYFDNIGLKTISKYIDGKYIYPVPTDSSLVNFYKLNIDENYNVRPKIIL